MAANNSELPTKKFASIIDSHSVVSNFYEMLENSLFAETWWPWCDYWKDPQNILFQMANMCFVLAYSSTCSKKGVLFMHSWLIIGRHPPPTTPLHSSSSRLDALLRLGLEHNLRSRRLHLELRFHAHEHGPSFPHPVPTPTGQVRPRTGRSLPRPLRTLQSTAKKCTFFNLKLAFQAAVQANGERGVRPGYVSARWRGLRCAEFDPDGPVGAAFVREGECFVGQPVPAPDFAVRVSGFAGV